MERRIMWWCDGATHFLLSRWNCHGRRGPFCLVPWSFTACVKITLRRVNFGFGFNQGLHICCMVGFLAFWPVVTVVYADDIVVLPCAFSFLFLGLWFLSSWACSSSFWSKIIVRFLLIFVRQSSYMWCWCFGCIPKSLIAAVLAWVIPGGSHNWFSNAVVVTSESRGN